MILVGVWLCARVAMFIPDVLGPNIVTVLDMLFLLFATISLGRSIILGKLWRNLLFVAILLLMTIMNGIMHYGILFSKPSLITQASTSMVLLVTLVMCIMGGRVFPMFTANGTQTPLTPAIPWLEASSVGSTACAVFLSFKLLPVNPNIIAGVFILSGLLNAVRGIRWKIWVTVKTPLVWSLHLSYWAVSLGLILFGLSIVTALVTQSQATHALTVGGMGVMILSMMSRISLGHTGRAIAIGKVMTSSFILILISFVVRVFGCFFTADVVSIITLSSALWVISYGCFVVMYLPILIKAKV